MMRFLLTLMVMMMDGTDTVVFETEYYTVVVGIGEMQENHKVKMYKVVNKQHNVSEIETTLYLRAIYECIGLNDEMMHYVSLKNMDEIREFFQKQNPLAGAFEHMGKPN